MLKKCKVKLLPCGTVTMFEGGRPTDDIMKMDSTNTGYHLYIISDDEIKPNDWYFNLDMQTVEFGIIRAPNERVAKLAQDASSCRKVIASTDPNLTTCNYCDSPINYDHKMGCENKVNGRVAGISGDFIRKYLSSNMNIDEVDVKYEITVRHVNKHYDVHPPLNPPSLVLSDDNEIIIVENTPLGEGIALIGSLCDELEGNSKTKHTWDLVKEARKFIELHGQRE